MNPIQTQSDIDAGLQDLLKVDPSLEQLADQCGTLPLRFQTPGFEGLARIIIGQMVSRASADAINARFADEINPATPQAYIEAGEAAWVRIGLSGPKQKTLLTLSHSILSGDLALDEIPTMPAEKAISTLTTLKGIGPWTAEVYLLFCAGHRDIFPAGDLALQEAIRSAQNLHTRPDEKQTREIARRWSPHRGIAARLFWSYYKVIKHGRDAVPL